MNKNLPKVFDDRDRNLRRTSDPFVERIDITYFPRMATEFLDRLRGLIQTEAETVTRLREIEAKKEIILKNVERDHMEEMARIHCYYREISEFSSTLKEEVRKASEKGDADQVYRLIQAWKELLINMK